MSLWKWSQTANTNTTADSTINWQEGQSPGSVNGSSRAMMAAVAKYRDDISGNLVTGGGTTAFTLTTNQGLTSLTDGFMVRARMNATNAATPTLNVDSLGAKAIVLDVSATAVPAGSLLTGQVYSFVYDSSADGWLVGDRFGDVLSAGGNPDLVAIEALSGTTGFLRKTAANTWSLDDGVTDIIFVKDNNGVVIPTGIQGDVHVPFACTITGVFLFTDQTGSIVIDLWKDTYANFPPTDGNSITSATPVTISSASKATDTTLTSWTTSVAAGDIIRVNVDSASTVTRFTLAIRVKRAI